MKLKSVGGVGREKKPDSKDQRGKKNAELEEMSFAISRARPSCACTDQHPRAPATQEEGEGGETPPAEPSLEARVTHVAWRRRKAVLDRAFDVDRKPL